MYREHWGLERKPFENAPDPEVYYLSPERVDALDRLADAIRERRPAGLLTGAYGCGKTTTIQLLAERLDLDQHRVIWLNYPRIGPERVLVELLEHVGETVEEGPDLHVRRMHRWGEILYRTTLEGRHTIVIVDEAQLIPQEETLEAIRRLMDVKLDGAALATYLIVGEPEVRERLARMPKLDERIVQRAHLSPLDRVQTGSYVAFRMEAAGCDREVFDEGAIDAIHEISHGTPRRINDVCDASLFLGARKKMTTIGADIVRKVA